jgi:hypothetical protein
MEGCPSGSWWPESAGSQSQPSLAGPGRSDTGPGQWLAPFRVQFWLERALLILAQQPWCRRKDVSLPRATITPTLLSHFVSLSP